MCNSKRGQGLERSGVQGKMRNSGEIDLYESFQGCMSINVRVPATGRGAPEASLGIFFPPFLPCEDPATLTFPKRQVGAQQYRAWMREAGIMDRLTLETHAGQIVAGSL